MKVNQIAVQAYTVRDALGSRQEIEEALCKIKQIGYSAVQLFGLPVPDAELAQMVKDSGLTCCSMHANGDSILGDTEAVIARANTLGTDHVAYPWPIPPPPPWTK